MNYNSNAHITVTAPDTRPRGNEGADEEIIITTTTTVVVHKVNYLTHNKDGQSTLPDRSNIIETIRKTYRVPTQEQTR